MASCTHSVGIYLSLSPPLNGKKQARKTKPSIHSMETFLIDLFLLAELYEIFLSRAKERWKSFSETNSENDVEGKTFRMLNRFFLFLQTHSFTSLYAVAALGTLAKI